MYPRMGNAGGRFGNSADLALPCCISNQVATNNERAAAIAHLVQHGAGFALI
jgi:hypothetical protein